MKTIFLRLLEETHDKQSALREAIAAGTKVTGKQRFEIEPETFLSVPGSPFAYWVTDSLRRLFTDLPLFENEGRVARRGVNTNDDQRFLRLAWECRGPQWVLHAKGGVWSPYYADPCMLLKWGSNGAELLAERVTTRVYKTAIVPSREFYFHAGLTWPRRTKSELSPRVMPAGCIFGDKGPAAIIEGDRPEALLSLLAITNSKAFRALIEFQLAAADAKPGGAAHSYEVGVLQRTPVPRLSQADMERLARLAKRIWSLRRSLDSRNELSHAFTRPALLQLSRNSMSLRVQEWIDRVKKIEKEITDLQNQIDQLCFAVYGISEADQRNIIDGFGVPSVSDEQTSSEQVKETESDDDEEEVEVGQPDNEQSLIAEVLSWAIGVVFGRFDPRVATGQRSLPPEPEPFDQLPSRSPGMWPEGEDSGPCPDILVDDEGHAGDLVARMRAAVERVGVDAPENLRAWLAKEFFPQHIKMYSKSRRKAPIYWQLATTSASYSVWLHIRAFTKDTLFRVQNDYAAPKLMHEERRLGSLATEFGDNGTVVQRREVAAQETFVEELRAFLEEVKRAAPLWNPNLDDGVIVNFAPLWRLVPQHSAWQKELRSTWDALCDAKCDWAQLAMHLWPERVVPKCATDRSLAIAHGLEDVFWVEGGDGKWKPRETPKRSISALVAERSSEAVKGALKTLLEAPGPTGQAKRGRKSKAA